MRNENIINLKKNGYKTKTFENGQSFLKTLNNVDPDLILLDLMLPDMDGYEICKQLKQDQRTALIPIIMLTAKGDESDKVIGLELGAEDYVTKPFSVKELMSRVKALLRRTAKPLGSSVLNLGGVLSVDPARYEVLLKGKKVELTSTEFKILYYLGSNPGIVFSREKILDHLWGQEKAVVDRTIDVHIKHLREKLGVAGEFIKNIRGVGYKVEQ